MLEDIFKRNNRMMLKKMLYIFIIINLLSYVFIFLLSNISKAATDNFSKYPGYQELIDQLKKEFPNSEFRMLKTGLDWNQVIKNETTASHGRNLTSNSASEWVCPVCKTKQYEAGWYCASEATVAYYMDPRNSLNTNDVFQFELLNYNADVQDEEGVKWIVSDCNFLQGKISYTATDGSTKSINKTYTQVIMEAGKKYNISPYHLASRIRQEQGTGNASETATGNGKGSYNKGYTGYYNYYNIGATGGSTSDIIKNALEKAKKEGWTDPEKAITGGAEFVKNEYIGYGQNTLYLQKFDVDNSDGDLYWHQYMTNVSASKSEGQETKNAYNKMGKLNKNSHFIFSIPVFENMPDQRCEMPGSNTIVTQNVEINADNVRVLDGKGEGKELTRLNKGDKILRIELSQTLDPDGRFMRYWDKVVLADGRKGYVVRNYLTQIADITNCNEKYVVTAYTNFRNGPGVTNTTILETLAPGQELTVIEKDKYKNVDGESWYRVKLPDGRQGYVGNGYIAKWDDNSSEYDKVKVIDELGVKVRESPGTSSKVLTMAYQGEILTRTQKNASNANGYIWDKVTTSGGIIGYVARGDDNEDYIFPVDESGNEGSEGDNIPSKNSQVKMDGKEVICDAVSNVNTIVSAYSGAVVKDSSGKQITGKTNVGTGYTVTINNKTYTIVKKGDVNGDANITPADATVALRSYVGLDKNTDVQNKAADTNKDGKVTPADATVILRSYVGLDKIEI